MLLAPSTDMETSMDMVSVHVCAEAVEAASAMARTVANTGENLAPRKARGAMTARRDAPEAVAGAGVATGVGPGTGVETGEAAHLECSLEPTMERTGTRLPERTLMEVLEPDMYRAKERNVDREITRTRSAMEMIRFYPRDNSYPRRTRHTKNAAI